MQYKYESYCNAGESILNRLAAIDGVGGDTGVKTQHQLRHFPPRHRHFDFF